MMKILGSYNEAKLQPNNDRLTVKRIQMKTFNGGA